MLNLNKNDRMNYNDGKNYMEFENICSALKESIPDFDIRTLKPYLWRDELSDIFMLAKKAEIYLYNRYTLNLYCWSKLAYDRIRKAGLIFEDSGREDTGIFIFKSDIKNLHELLKLGAVKQRMSMNSNKRKRFENLLGHKIFKCELDHRTWKAVQSKSSYGECSNLKINPHERAENAA